MTDNTVFAKILRGELPCVKVYEDEDFLVIQNIVQDTPGHSLLIPKEPSVDILGMSSTLGNNMLAVIQRIGKAMMEGLGADGFNVGINTKPAAGQVIFYTHIHIIPRYKNDGLQPWAGKDADEETRLKYASKIISALDE